MEKRQKLRRYSSRKEGEEAISLDFTSLESRGYSHVILKLFGRLPPRGFGIRFWLNSINVLRLSLAPSRSQIVPSMSVY